MGIPDLWQIVSGAAQNCSLIEFALVAGIQHEDGRMLRIGVDASIWMVQCEAMFWGPQHAQAGDSPELRTLMFRLAYLLRCAVIPVFVFDGALRPGVKRGKKVKARARWLEKHFKEMIRAFGFYYHDAPGEAEAELAAMNKTGSIDAIITEDSDVLVFGGMCILRRPPRLKGDNGKKIKIDPDEYVLYSSKHILARDDVSLTEGGLFLLAILLGGDYDGTKGLSGCGRKTAYALAQTGLGDSLCLAAKTMGDSELRKYLTGWRDMLRSELLQPSIPGASKHPSLANKIPVTFPNMQVLKYYAQPITSWHAGSEELIATAWKVPLPNIALISDFCSRFFHWDSDVLLQRLRKNIWPGIIVQSLYRLGNRAFATPPESGINMLHCISDGSLANHSIQAITACTASPPTYTVRVSTCLLDEQATGDSNWTLHKMNIKIPAIILRSALPIMVEVYHERNTALPHPYQRHSALIDYIGAHRALGGFILSDSMSATNEDPSADITHSQNNMDIEDEDVGIGGSDMGSDRGVISSPNEVIDLTLDEDNRCDILGIDEGGRSTEQDDNEAIIVLTDSDSDSEVEIVGYSVFIDLADSDSDSEVEVVG